MHGEIIVLIGNIPSFLILFREEFVKELVKQGYKVYCLANKYSLEEAKTVESWGAIPVNHEIDVKGLNPIADLRATYKLYKFFKMIQPDIVLATFVKPVIFGGLAARLANVKNKVGMIEGLGNAFTMYKRGLNRKAKLVKYIQVLLYKLSLPLLDKVILLNDDDYKDLIERYKIPVKQLHILGGIGVDLDKFRYTSPDMTLSPTFLFIARLVEAKGIFEYIEAAKIVKKKFPHAVFRVIGGLDIENPFSIGKETLNQYVAEGLIDYKGHVSNVVEQIQQSHVFVLPSYREGVPRSTQEAMSVGRAVVTTNVPGCRVTVVHGRNGFLVDKWDIEALAASMSFFLENPEKIELMGLESRKMAEQLFDVHDVNRRLIQMLKN